MYKFDKLKHIHSYNGKLLMGTSTVVGILNKPLAWWASSMAVGTLGWINSKLKVSGKYIQILEKDRLKVLSPIFAKIKKMTPKQFLAELDIAYRAHNQKKEDTAEVGTDRHAALEAYVKMSIGSGGSPMIYNGPNPDVKKFSDFAIENIKKFLWSEVHGYSLATWTGGICDVGWIDMEGRVVVGDFKSSREAYFAHFIQIGGYHQMLSENGGFNADGLKIFELPKKIDGYCVMPFGLDGFSPQFVWDVDSYRNGFISAVQLYKLHQVYIKPVDNESIT